MATPLEIVKRSARGASGTNSPQLYIIGFILVIVALLVIYEIIRTTKLIGSTWKNITSRFRILILTSCFLQLALTSILFLISFNWKSIFPLLFFYNYLPAWLQFCTFILYILYLSKTFRLVEGKQTKAKKYFDFIFAFLIIGSFILVILVSYFNGKNLEDGKNNSNSGILEALYIVILMLPLVILFIVMGVKYYKKFQGYILVKIQKERIKYTIILLLIDGSIFTIFLIYALVATFGKNKITKSVDDYLENKEYSKFDTYVLIFTFIFIVIPAFVLFIILHRVLTIEKRMFQREENVLLADPDDDYNIDNINGGNEYKLFDVKN
ncbi:hypothetical protein M0811_00711 [Anaeramoeba ignava]|uniref:Uncharacterized protein n=1 Tax=Anaeramoeba ignava TaxID=1746090 RepID=A0A9Q0RC14_ANAIG|nr:hypothetical protein M0811_00711 [Anaeramoeba ignava]